MHDLQKITKLQILWKDVEIGIYSSWTMDTTRLIIEKAYLIEIDRFLDYKGGTQTLH